jgi:hypothetical protein
VIPRVPDKEPVFVLGRPEWWLWPTILSLDAPAVALAWQSLLALVVGVKLAAHHSVLLGLSVWLAYAADRWIEGWRLTPQTVRTQRHAFFLRWRWPDRRKRRRWRNLRRHICRRRKRPG